MNKKEYYNLFCRKLQVILSQLMRRSCYKIEPDFFMIAVTTGTVVKSGLHDAGTSFKFVSLLDIFADELKEMLPRLKLEMLRRRDKVIFYRT